MSDNRFVGKTFSELQDANRSPIFGYEDQPILTLEESVEKLIPSIPRLMDYATTAKKKFNRHSSLLTRDEAAAIYLYTMPNTSFFKSLNTTLRAEDRNALKPWFAFLKLFMTALSKLPSVIKLVWRGVCENISSTFEVDDIHIWWSVNSCSMAINVVEAFLGNGGTLFAVETSHGKDVSAFSACSDEQEIVLMPGSRVRRKAVPFSFSNRLFVVHLEEINLQNERQSKSSYLFDQIRQEYLKNNRLHRLINPSQSFSIEQGYINLVIVNAKDQREKEKQLHDIQHGDAIRGTYEDIYGVKTTIDVKDILQACKSERKQVLVFGRAGIGKSTFCRYIAYQWARGLYWSEYELVALIPLRRLTVDRYPSNKSYSLVDLVKKEVFSFELSKKEEQLFGEQFDAKKTLWILDGYDEIKDNIPPHLEPLFEHLLNTPHHILTSRPYLNTLSYEVQMEITGFTDKNIEEYVHQFFTQMEDKSEKDTKKKDTLLRFLKSKQSIWGIAHIPVNLELICSVWSNSDLLEKQNLTITTLYSTITDWLCRRYLISQNQKIESLLDEEVYAHCQKELTFLERLAFHAMDTNTVIIRPLLLKKVSEETKLASQDYLKILQLGFLKSFHKQTTGVYVEQKKDHYFVHLSFQEYFAARYLIRALNERSSEDARMFINRQKYNQRYALVFNFMAGLVAEACSTSRIETFWNIILGEPVDLVGTRHMQLIISCMDATADYSIVPHHTELIKWIAECIQYHILQTNRIILNHILQPLGAAESITNNELIVNMLLELLKIDDTTVQKQTLYVLSQLTISNQLHNFTSLLTISLNHKDTGVKMNACEALGKMGEKAATNEVIDKLVSALGDQNEWVRDRACEALGEMCEKAATNEVIDKLVSALGDQNEWVRDRACEALGNMGEKAATNEVIDKLVSALGDQDEKVRSGACYALGKMGEKAATNEVIDKLVSALGDEDDWVRRSACEALGKMGEKAATNDVIDKLVSALGDQDEKVRSGACYALGEMGEKAATNEVIDKLVRALEDQDEWVRTTACEALGKMGEKAATNEVISKFLTVIKLDVSFFYLGVESAVRSLLKSTSLLGQLDSNILLNFYRSETKVDVLGNIAYMS